MTTDVINNVPRELHLRTINMLQSYVSTLAGIDFPDNDEGDYRQRINEYERSRISRIVAELRALLATAQPAADGEREIAYDRIDRYLRNNLDDDDYAEFSASLDKIAAQPAKAEGVAVPVEFVRFLLGEVKFNGYSFDDMHQVRVGKYWWRSDLRAWLSAAPVPPVIQAIFTIGDHVRKTKGSRWQGRIVGTYSTALTPEGYAVESDTETGSVQIYPVSALERVRNEGVRCEHD